MYQNTSFYVPNVACKLLDKPGTNRRDCDHVQLPNFLPSIIGLKYGDGKLSIIIFWTLLKSILLKSWTPLGNDKVCEYFDNQLFTWGMQDACMANAPVTYTLWEDNLSPEDSWVEVSTE